MICIPIPAFEIIKVGKMWEKEKCRKTQQYNYISVIYNYIKF